MVDRSVLLSPCPTNNMRGFEVGALLSAFLSKRDNDVVFVDRLTTDELRRKFAEEPSVDIEQIVQVDFVVSNGDSVEEVSPVKGAGFDFAIASHVIEHIPNIVAWLEQRADLVKTGGRLLLVVPDKRYIFDYLRQIRALIASSRHTRSRKPGPGLPP